MIYYFQKKEKEFEIEMCKQVRFRIIDSSIGDTTEILGGIGIYEDADNENDERLINVICGCCVRTRRCGNFGKVSLVG